MKKIILLLMISTAFFSVLSAKDCFVEFQEDVGSAERELVDGFESRESNWDTRGHCNREVLVRYSHRVGSAAIAFDKCAEEENLYP